METRSRTRLASQDSLPEELKKTTKAGMANEVGGQELPAPKKADDSLGLDSDGTSSDEEVILPSEVDDLKSDELYAGFVKDVLTHGTTCSDEVEAQDPSYVSLTAAGDAEEGHEQVEGDASSDTSEDENEEDDEEESAENVAEMMANPSPDVPIPRAALLAASARFPPFWRTKNQLASLEAASYHSEQDPTFEPSGEEEDDAEALEAEHAESSEEEETQAEEVAVEAEKLGELDDLAEVMQDLSVREMEDDDEDQVEEEATHVSLVEAITSFDHEGYDSATDPDFDPEAAAKEVEDTENMDSSENTEGDEEDGDKMDE